MSTAANNITLNAGSGGPVVATDFVTYTAGISAHVQYVKLDIGGENAHLPVTQSRSLPVSINSLPSGWTSLPVGGGTGGQGITITGNIEAGAVSLTGASFSDLLTAVRGITINSIAAGVTFGIVGVGGGAIGVTVDKVNVAQDGTNPPIIQITGGTIGEITLVSGVSGATITNVVAGITIGVSTVGFEAVAITTGGTAAPGFFPVATSMSQAAIASFTSGSIHVTNITGGGIANGFANATAAVTFPDYKAKHSVTIHNLASTSATNDANPVDFFKEAGVGNTPAAGAILVLGQGTGCSAAAGGITYGTIFGTVGLTGSRPFRVVFPGEKVTYPIRDLEDFRAHCITGPGGETNCTVMFDGH